MNVLSCFDGISAGRLALQRAGIEVGTYYRSEVDKYADKVAMHHFPNDIQLGDVTKWREWNIDWSSIDMLIGGSPCQGFSFAGKQAGTKAVLNGEDILVTDRETYLDMKEKGAEFLSQSYLFWEYVLILDHIKSHNPSVKFLLENVKMKKELLEMIDTAMAVKSVVINSSLVSGQNRVRHYWANWEITQPEDKGILLRDILEGVGEGSTYNRKDGLGKPLEKSLAICASDWRGLNRNQNQTAVVTGGAIRGRYNEDGSTSQRLEVNDTGRTNALTTVQKDNVVCFVKDNKRVKAITEDERGYRPHRGDDRSTGISELGRIIKPMGKTDTLTSSHAPKMALNSDIGNLQYRKLTPIECERLQTFPDNYTSMVSNTQRYRSLGNSWTVDAIAHIFKCM